MYETTVLDGKVDTVGANVGFLHSYKVTGGIAEQAADAYFATLTDDEKQRVNCIKQRGLNTVAPLMMDVVCLDNYLLDKI